MERSTRIGMLTACVALAMGCDDRAEVQTHDLEEARKNTGELTQGAGEPAASPPVSPMPSDARRDDLVPVRGADTDDDNTPAAQRVAPPPAPEQLTSPVTDPRGDVPPLPPRLSPNSKVAPSDPRAPADLETRGMP